MYPGTIDDYRGYLRHVFQLHGNLCYVVEPKQTAPGKPWIWRARFFDAFPYVDLALLERGYHLVYTDVADLYGCDEAVTRFDRFYRFLTEEQGFPRRCVMEGYSRGGLIAYNWGRRNPDKLVCIYADNPVCDFKSWPLGLGTGPGSKGDAEKLFKAYGFKSLEEARAYTGNPLDNLESLAEGGVPLIHCCGDADEVVPYPENTEILAERYRKLGGVIDIIIKPGEKHHPHCMENPAPLLELIFKAARLRFI